MGDPEAIGKALDQVHKPWLGWLWKVSRWLLIVLAVTVVFTAWFLDGAVTVYERLQVERECEDPPAAACRTALPHGEVWVAPGEITVEDGQYRTVVELWYWEESDMFTYTLFSQDLPCTVTARDEAGQILAEVELSLNVMELDTQELYRW